MAGGASSAGGSSARAPSPGPDVQRAPDLEREIGARTSGEVYVFRDGPAESTAALMIFVNRDSLGDDKLALQTYLSTMGGAMAMERDTQPGVAHRIDVEELTEQPPYVARTWGYHSGVRSASIARVAHPGGAKQGHVVALLALGRYPAELGPVLESLHVLPEPPRGRSLEQQRRRFPELRQQRKPPRARSPHPSRRRRRRPASSS